VVGGWSEAKIWVEFGTGWWEIEFGFRDMDMGEIGVWIGLMND
jgi:hypothetical protein